MRIESESAGVAVHLTHTLTEDGEEVRCIRCLAGLALKLRLPCPGGGASITYPRPWRAEPVDPRQPHNWWHVVAPSRTGKGEVQVAGPLSELDALAIAAGGNAKRSL